MSTDDFGKRVRQARLALGISQEHVAQAAGTTQSTVDRIENGGALRSRYRDEVAQAVGIKVRHEIDDSIPDVAFTSKRKPEPKFLGARDLRVFSSVEGGPGEMSVFSVDPLEIVSRPWYVERDPEAYGIFLTGESMEPKYEAGQIIVVSPRSPLVKGKGFVVTAEPVGGDFRASLKLYRGQTEKHWLAKQLNPEQEIKFEKDVWRKAYRVLGTYEG